MQFNRFACGALAIFLLTSLCFGFNQTQQQEAFNLAWSEFSSGDLTAAEQIVNDTLNEGIAEPRLYANFLYLKGHIQGQQPGGGQSALGTLNEARDLYLDENLIESAFITNLSMARIHIDLDNYTNAEAVLIDNLSLGTDHGLALGETYYLASRVVFLQNDVAAALTYSELSHGAFLAQNKHARAHEVQTEIGLFAMLNGDWSQGNQETTETSEEAYSSKQLVYSMVNKVFFERCVNENIAQAMIQTIRDHAEHKNDVFLNETLDMVLRVDCGVSDFRDGDPPKPPPPPPGFPP